MESSSVRWIQIPVLPLNPLECSAMKNIERVQEGTILRNEYVQGL